MKISRSNYEYWYLDYIEGNLDQDTHAEFESFLIRNPDLGNQLEADDIIPLSDPQSICFEPKELLKKTEFEDNGVFEEYAIAYHEQDLTSQETVIFENWLTVHPDKKAQVNFMGSLKLKADQTVTIDFTERLKRREQIVPFWIQLTSVAAILILVFLLFIPDKPFNTKKDSELAMVTEKVNTVPETKTAKTAEKLILKEKSVPPKTVEKGSTDLKPEKVIERKQPEKVQWQKVSEPQLQPTDPAPSLMKIKSIKLGQQGNIELASIKSDQHFQNDQDFQISEMLQARLEEIRNSHDRDLLTTENLGVAGLNLFAKLTGKRLTGRKGSDGTLKTVSYNSKILAFSIPVNR